MELQPGMTVTGYEQDSDQQVTGIVVRVSAMTAVIEVPKVGRKVIRLKDATTVRDGVKISSNTLGDRLKAHRAAKGLTQQQVADEVNINQVYLSLYERDKKEMDTHTLESFAKLYGVSPEELKTGKPPMQGAVRSYFDPSIIKKKTEKTEAEKKKLRADEKLFVQKDGSAKLVRNEPAPEPVKAEPKKLQGGNLIAERVQAAIYNQQTTERRELDAVRKQVENAKPVVLKNEPASVANVIPTPKEEVKEMAEMFNKLAGNLPPMNQEELEMVNKPNHYIGKKGLEVREIEKQFAPDGDGYRAATWCNALEYLIRYPNKNGLEDLRKLQNNVNELIEIEERLLAEGGH